MFIDQAIQHLAGRRLLLADPSAKGRGQLARYLRSVGVEVVEAGSADEVSDLLAVGAPALLMIDIDTPGDVRRTLREAAESRRASGQHRPVTPLMGADEASALLPTPVRTIVTCRARTPREQLMSTLIASVGAVLVTPCRPELVISRLAKLVAPNDGPAANAAISVVSGCEALMVEQVRCPFHDPRTPARRYALRAGRTAIEPDFFDVPIYSDEASRISHIDFHQVCVTVCPDCLFASPDPAHFCAQNPRGHAGAAAAFPASARYAIISRIHQRREIFTGSAGGAPGTTDPMGDAFFNEHRTPEQAVRSFELALHCSQALHAAAPRQFTEEPIRQGNYHLRMAHLRERIGQPLSTRDPHIQQAAQILKDATPHLTDELVPRNAYQVIATSIYLGRDHDARQHLTQLAKLAQSTGDAKVKTLADRYLFRSAKAWENREHHRRRADVPQVFAPFLVAA